MFVSYANAVIRTSTTLALSAEAIMQNAPQLWNSTCSGNRIGKLQTAADYLAKDFIASKYKLNIFRI